MRIGLSAGVAALLALAGTALADPPPPATPPNSAVAYYPPEALAAGVDGTATIRCQRDIRGAYVGCNLVSEHPAGHGFGAAALAVAANAPPHTLTALSPYEMALELPFNFSFRAQPPSVRPDLFQASTSPPRWLTRPSADDIARVYPVHAAAIGLGAHTVMTCTVDDKGGMAACGIDSETPADLGFGAAMLKLSHDFRMTTFTEDGRPTLGVRVVIPMRWIPPA